MRLPPELQARWNATSPREQRWLIVALSLVLLALLWWLAIAPALSTLKVAKAQRAELSAQLLKMQRMQAQAKALQAQPRLALEDARHLLEASVKPLGTSAKLAIAGERATLSVRGASADALAQWLVQARLNAHAVPAQVRLQRSAASPDRATPTGQASTWDGTLLMVLDAH